MSIPAVFGAFSPAMRNLRAFQQDVLAFFTAQMGPTGIDTFPLGVRRAVLVTEPSLVATAIDHPALVRDRRPLGPLGTFGGYAPIFDVIGEGLPLLDDRHDGNVLERRRRVARLLSEGGQTRSADVDDFAGAIGGDGVDLGVVVARSVLRRLCVRLFGDPCLPHLDALAAALEQTTHFGHQQSVGAPLWSRWWGEVHDGIIAARLSLETFANAILDDPRLQDAPARRAFADAPRALQVDELITQVLAGTETTSLAICWTTWLLAAHPEWRAAVQRDVDDDALDLRTLRLFSDRPIVQCVREALRLYPSFWQLFRVAEAPCTLQVPDTTADHAVAIDVGDVVFCCLSLANRFPGKVSDPDAFRPGRDDPVPYLSFGVGGRGCIGARLGFTLVLETLRDLFTVADIEPLDLGRPVHPLVHGLHRRGGFPARLRPRAVPTKT